MTVWRLVVSRFPPSRMALNGPPALSCLLGGEIFNPKSTQKSSNVRGPRGREIVITGWERRSGSLARRGSHALSAPSTGLTQACQSASPVWSLQGSQDFQGASVPPPLFGLAPGPIAGTMEPVGHLITRRSRPSQIPSPPGLRPSIANSNPQPRTPATPPNAIIPHHHDAGVERSLETRGH